MNERAERNRQQALDDGFLHAWRSSPSTELAARIRDRLRDSEEIETRVAPRTAKWMALAASVLLVASVVVFPSVRAGAQAFLDLFRVVNFAAVSFDPANLQALDASGLDFPRMLGEQIEVLEQGGDPVSFATPEEAGAAVGLTVELPAFVPADLERTAVAAVGGTAIRFTASTAKLQAVLDTLGISDLSVPAGLDGQVATVRVPPIVRLKYGTGARSVEILQGRTPEVSFPAGVDLAALAEIGLRILGLGRAEAYRFAQNIDWRSTLIVPVPTSGTFRQVDVQGHGALLITAAGDASSGGRFSQLLWSTGDRVFAMIGTLRPEEMMAIAESVQ
ncbi:MAG TPA: hypothetical protein VFV10_12205 [Gammaproteobacteria bacterium]|nr:hypothetical protein [Gammaproteobacteria bacterium]